MPRRSPKSSSPGRRGVSSRSPKKSTSRTSSPKSKSPKRGTKKSLQIGKMTRSKKTTYGEKNDLPRYEPSFERVMSSLPDTRVSKKSNLERISAKMDDGRGSRTRGWDAAAPQKGKERKELAAKCGAKVCFLRPDDLGFPICPALRTTGGECAVDCRGIQTAYQRARQWKYDDIANKALSVRSERCGR